MTTTAVSKKEALLQYIVPVVAALSVFIIGYQWASVRLYWYDELLTLQLATDPSLIHALNALYHHVDGQSPLYVILTWLWAKIVGVGEVEFRLLTIIINTAATYILFRYVLWRKEIFLPLLLPLFFIPTEILSGGWAQWLVEARSYSLLILAASMVLALPRVAQEYTSSVVPAIWSFCAFLILSLSHAIAPIYLACFLTALYLASGVASELRRCWMPAFLGSLGWLLWCPFFLQQMKINDPVSWVYPKSFSWFLEESLPLGYEQLLLLLMALCIYGVILFGNLKNKLFDKRAAEAQHSLYALCIICSFGALLPWVLYLLQFFDIQLGVSRYFIMQVIFFRLVTLLLFCFGLQYVVLRLSGNTYASNLFHRILVAIVFVSFSAYSTYAVSTSFTKDTIPTCEEFSYQIGIDESKDVPIVVESEQVFRFLQHYWSCDLKESLRYPLDYDIALKSNNLERSRIPIYRIEKASLEQYAVPGVVATKELLTEIQSIGAVMLLADDDFTWDEEYLVDEKEWPHTHIATITIDGFGRDKEVTLHYYKTNLAEESST